MKIQFERKDFIKSHFGCPCCGAELEPSFYYCCGAENHALALGFVNYYGKIVFFPLADLEFTD